MSEPSRLVRNKVGEVRRSKLRFMRSLHGAQLGMLGLGSLCAIAVLDYQFELPTAIRVLGLMLAVAILAAWGRRSIVASRYGVAEAAADVEAEFPEYGQRIRTTIDYSDPTTPTAAAAPNLLQRLEADTKQLTEPQNFERIVDRRPLRRAMFGLASMALVMLLALALNSELRIGLGRTFLLPFQYTNLTVDAIDEPIPSGQDATVVARVDGRPVDAVQLYYRPVGTKDWKALDFTLVSVDDEDAVVDGLRGELSATIEDCQGDLEYRVAADDHHSGIYQLRVLAPLELEQLVADVQPPLYTALQPETTDSLDLKVVEGTDIQFTLTLNRDAAEAQLRRLPEATKNEAESTDANVPLEIVGTTLKGQFDNLRESQRFVISARTADGIEYNSPRFRIRVRADGSPKIRFVSPPEELELVPTAEVALAVDVADDYGISKLGVAAQIADGPLETLWEQDYGGDPTLPRETRAQPVLYLEEHDLTFQDAVTYYAYAVDNRPDGGKRTTTELRFIDIRPFKREYQILKSGGM